ncbi:hypothetical protein DID88_000409 [Monilinia fructigena]|uniref:Uncharacterized protein n=1 Tax=Monilinia fructigena TaxID=38457 RepID=A0A395IHT2_9HELO|nr:hypothetical protein DID88_000409 [Monilinia fructigena]
MNRVEHSNGVEYHDEHEEDIGADVFFVALAHEYDEGGRAKERFTRRNMNTWFRSGEPILKERADKGATRMNGRNRLDHLWNGTKRIDCIELV